MKIVLIEDDRKLAALIERVLHEEGYVVDSASDGATGLELVLRGVHSVAIIDWMLPERDGLAICRAIRAAKLPIAVLLLTARGQVEDRVIGLDSGADDYLTKPFALSELLARIRALSRRFTPPQSEPTELRCGDLVLDMRAHTARRAEQALDLTATEWTLLECLIRNAGHVLTRNQLLDSVWSYDRAVQPGLVDVYISYLRRKLDLPGRRDPIRTVRGVGYALEPDDA